MRGLRNQYVVVVKMEFSKVLPTKVLAALVALAAQSLAYKSLAFKYLIQSSVGRLA